MSAERVNRTGFNDSDLVTTTKAKVTFGDNPNDVMVIRVYDTGNNLLESSYTSVMPNRDPRTGGFVVDPREDLISLGFGVGKYKIEYLFWRYVVGEFSRVGVFIDEVSTNKTEVRIRPINDPKASEQFYKFRNMVLSGDDVDAFVDNVMVDVDIQAVSNNITPTDWDRMSLKYNKSVEDIKDIIQTIIDDAKVEFKEFMKKKADLTPNQINLMLNTIIKKHIKLHLG